MLRDSCARGAGTSQAASMGNVDVVKVFINAEPRAVHPVWEECLPRGCRARTGTGALGNCAVRSHRSDIYDVKESARGLSGSNYFAQMICVALLAGQPHRKTQIPTRVERAACHNGGRIAHFPTRESCRAWR